MVAIENLPDATIQENIQNRSLQTKARGILQANGSHKSSPSSTPKRATTEEIFRRLENIIIDLNHTRTSQSIKNNNYVPRICDGSDFIPELKSANGTPTPQQWLSKVETIEIN